MKLLIINYSDNSGGAAKATHRIYKSLKKKINVYLYVIDKKHKDKKIITNFRFYYFLALRYRKSKPNRQKFLNQYWQFYIL